MDKTPLELALALMQAPGNTTFDIPLALPEQGLGDLETLRCLAPKVLGEAAQLGNSTTLAHMDPPTETISWATTLWNASLNQNLLHPATSPFASGAEATCISWLAPFFGMSGGHFCSGSTLGNLTALWAARNCKGVTRVFASELAHNSISKCCNMLGLQYESLPVNDDMTVQVPASGLQGSCLVLTAGTTGGGAIDPLHVHTDADWMHVDAAWAGPLRLTGKYAPLLDGIERADSVAVSAHKMLLQPKDSAFVLFKHYNDVLPSISTAGAYLAKPTVGIQGSRSAAATVVLSYLLARGRHGVEQTICTLMRNAETLYAYLSASPHYICAVRPVTGVNVFQHRHMCTSELLSHLPEGTFSTFRYRDEDWVRSVSANPNADVEQIIHWLDRACA